MLVGAQSSVPMIGPLPLDGATFTPPVLVESIGVVA
jgi:hypothetical protein